MNTRAKTLGGHVTALPKVTSLRQGKLKGTAGKRAAIFARVRV